MAGPSPPKWIQYQTYRLHHSSCRRELQRTTLLLTERCRSVLTSNYYQQQFQQLSLLAAFQVYATSTNYPSHCGAAAVTSGFYQNPPRSAIVSENDWLAAELRRRC